MMRGDWHGGAELAEFGHGFLQRKEPLGRAKRQRLQQDAVDDAEDDRVCADSQRQNQDRDDREPPVSGQRSNAEPNVVPKCSHLYFLDVYGARWLVVPVSWTK